MDSLYQLVTIKYKKFTDGKVTIIVPKSYITTNDQLQSFVRYLPAPHSEDDKQLIDTFVKSKAVPPENWLSYKCEQKSIAGMYA